MHDLLRWLAPVRSIELRTDHFRRVQLHRNNRIYAFLLHICEFVHEHWLPAEHGGTRRFRDFVRDGLPRLFENFVLNFYRHELPAEWSVSAPVIQWQITAPNADALALVPRMETDLCLRGPGRAIILDTKFYAQALKAGAYGTARLPSANLYQLFTYLRQQSCEVGWDQAEGVLLYPRTTRDFAVEFTTHGHRIRALSLDLAQTWQNIHVALMQVVAADPAISTMPHSFSPDDVAFYDALATNDSAVQAMGDDKLKLIAAELISQVKKSVTIDGTLWESARAKIKVMVKRILNRHGYPPDLQEEAVKTVLAQAELLCAKWV